jgi:hypothetical protein
MTIFIDADTITNLTNYDGLLLAVAKWLERDDLTDQIPDFVRLAEARFRRVLVMPDMETQVWITPAATVDLPADFDSIRSFGILGYPPMDQLSLADFYALPTDAIGNPIEAQPTKFAIVAGKFAFWPLADKAYSVKLTYRANLPSLTLADQTNWMLAKHPDAYLFATLLQAEFYGWNDDRLPTIKAALDEILSEVLMSGTRQRYGSGPLTMKPAVSERMGLRW